MMLDNEKEAYLMLGEAAAVLSLAYNLVKREKVKQVVPAVRNEVIALSKGISGSAQFDTARVEDLSALISIKGSPQPSTRPSLNLGSAALDLACAKVKHAAAELGLRNPWGMATIALDNLNKLAGVLYTLARWEEQDKS